MIVETWQEGSEYVASTDQFAVHAFGDTPGEAVANLYGYLPEFLSILQQEGDNLAPWMADTRDRLADYLNRRHEA